MRDDSFYSSSDRFNVWQAWGALVLADCILVILAVVTALQVVPLEAIQQTEAWNGTGRIAVLALFILTHVIALGLSEGYAAPESYKRGAFLRMTLALGAASLFSLATVILLGSASFISAHPFVSAKALLIYGVVTTSGLIGLRAGLSQWTTGPNEVKGRGRTPARRRALSQGREIEHVKLSDITDRPPVRIDTRELQRLFRDRTVLVTGAGGSIGHVLCKQIMRLRPRHLVMADMSEYNLFRLENTIGSRYRDVPTTFSITDVRDPVATERLFRTHRPSIVLHTAAYKHVPMMERHPAASFENNTQATRLLVDLASTYGADQFVFVSTDKAVEPKSILGATKRLAEWYVRSSDSDMRCKTVRFGNVFGSRGSVVPFFEQCLRDGEPLPITHPDMERYFMTADEACNLILQTLLHDDFPVYLLRMGDPIRIEWLARRMIEARFPNRSADSMIEYVGCRPGEKLKEQLVTPGETIQESAHDSILGIDGPRVLSKADLVARFEHFTSISQNPELSADDLRQHLFDIAHPAAGDGQATDNPPETVHGEMLDGRMLDGRMLDGRMPRPSSSVNRSSR